MFFFRVLWEIVQIFCFGLEKNSEGTQQYLNNKFHDKKDLKDVIICSVCHNKTPTIESFQKQINFLTVLEIKVLADLVPGQGSPPGLQMAAFSHCLHSLSSIHEHGARMHRQPVSFLKRTLTLPDKGPPLWPHSTLIIS